MVPPSETNLSVNGNSLNPKASHFNGHFKRSDSRDCSKTLGELRVQNVGNVIIAHLNINSIRNKFDNLVELIGDNIDILIILEKPNLMKVSRRINSESMVSRNPIERTEMQMEGAL